MMAPRWRLGRKVDQRVRLEEAYVIDDVHGSGPTDMDFCVTVFQMSEILFEERISLEDDDLSTKSNLALLRAHDVADAANAFALANGAKQVEVSLFDVIARADRLEILNRSEPSENYPVVAERVEGGRYVRLVDGDGFAWGDVPDQVVTLRVGKWQSLALIPGASAEDDVTLVAIASGAFDPGDRRPGR